MRHLVNAGKTNPKRTQTNPNKANFKKAKMNVSKVLAMDYEKKLNGDLLQNEPNSNPNKPNFRANICCRIGRSNRHPRRLANKIAPISVKPNHQFTTHQLTTHYSPSVRASCKAARASSRVESSVGRGQSFGFTSRGISVHPSTAASQPFCLNSFITWLR